MLQRVQSTRVARSLVGIALFMAGVIGCGAAEDVAPRAAAPEPPPSAVKHEKAAPALAFLDDDLPGAVAKARAEKKALLVDVWAPWCHTCLSMQAFVLRDPSLAGLSDRVVAVAIDSDKPSSAAFLSKHKVSAWPTYFVLDPARDEVLGVWAGSMSLGEMRAFVEASAASMTAGPNDDAGRALKAARSAHAAGKLRDAAADYARAIEKGGASWPHKSAALVGWMQALYGERDHAECARVGRDHVGDVRGASVPADFASYLLMCAEGLPKGPDRDKSIALAVARLRELGEHPPDGASADDRADMFAVLADGLEARGDADGAKRAQERRLAILEEAARKATSVDQARAFDYGRMGAYLALGRGEEAVKMLEAREKELPDSYEPPARLASALFKMGKHKEALAAADRAIKLAYGPRRLRYLKLRADILQRLGDKAARVEALRAEVAGWESLPPGQASPADLASAKKRLAEAEKP